MIHRILLGTIVGVCFLMVINFACIEVRGQAMGGISIHYSTPYMFSAANDSLEQGGTAFAEVPEGAEGRTVRFKLEVYDAQYTKVDQAIASVVLGPGDFDILELENEFELPAVAERSSAYGTYFYLYEDPGVSLAPTEDAYSYKSPW